MTNTPSSLLRQNLSNSPKKPSFAMWLPLSTVAFILIISWLFVSWSLSESLAHGRLAAAPAYDDVAYFYAGTKTLQSLRDGYVLQTLFGPMHSPFSVLLAAASFAIWGAEDWAPYAGNAIVIIFYLGALYYFLRKIPLGLQMGMLLVFLSVPFAKMAVVEFRPDMMWAILVGCAAVYQVTANGAFSSRVEAMVLGCLYGAALMTKPSTFLMTTAVIGLGGLLRTLRGAFTGKLAASRFFVWLLLFLLSAFVVAGPYYLLHFERVWNYFYVTSFGTNKALWTVTQTLPEQLGYYIDSRNASTTNLGKWRLPILVFVGLALLYNLLRAKESERRAIFWCLATLVIATWLASSLIGLKSPFLGGAFYGTLLFAAAYLLGALFESSPRSLSRPLVQSFAFVGLAAISFAMYTWPTYSEWNPDRAGYFRRANEGVWKQIRRASRKYAPADGVLDIYYSNTSPIPHDLHQLQALRNRVSLRMHSGSMANSLETQRAIFERCDVLIVQDAALPEVNPNFPGEKIQAWITQEVLSRPEFDLASEIPVSDKKRIYVLRNKQSLILKE